MWGPEEQKAFNMLKALVTQEPVLAHLDLTQQFKVEVDASGYAMGAMLLQRKEDRKKHPIGYFSATLNEAQRNNDIYTRGWRDQIPEQRVGGGGAVGASKKIWTFLIRK